MTTFLCVASGPSLVKADIDLLRHMPTISTNNSFMLADNSSYVYAMDAAWWDKYKDQVPSKMQGVSNTQYVAQSYGLIHHKETICRNSGSAAIDYAMKLGATTIILLGYDCSIKNGTHWHGDHEELKNPKQHNVDVWHKDYLHLSRVAKHLGVRIVNCSRYTEIECFQRGDVKDYALQLAV